MLVHTISSTNVLCFFIQSVQRMCYASSHSQFNELVMLVHTVSSTNVLC